jgi:signal transduction histidine kinase
LDNIPISQSYKINSEPDFANIKKEVMEELSSYFPDIKGEFYEKNLDFFFKAVVGEMPGKEYISFLDKSLNFSSKANVSDENWEKYISILRKKILPYFYEKIDILIRIENLIHQSRVVIKEFLILAEKNKKVMFSDRTKTLQQILRDFVNLFNIESLFDKMAAGLPRMGVTQCYLSLYASKEKILNEAKLVMAFDQNGRINLDGKNVIFNVNQLFPDDINVNEKRYDFIIESLFYENEQLGLIVLEVNQIEGILISSMTDQIQSTIKSSMLINETMVKEKELEKAFIELKENHQELEQAYKNLKENKEKLLVSEKMASLGRLTSGIAHEINTPIATARAALFELANLIKEDGSCDMKPENTEDHNLIVSEMIRSVSLADKAIEKAASFIKSIKSQTREMSHKEGIMFNVTDIISEAILLLGHILKNGGLSIEFNHPDKPVELFGHPGRISQVITNLITNAADAMEDKKGEMIKINLINDEKKIIIRVEDKGNGIPESIRTKIFDPLFTTKPFGKGTGLGLTIVHDIICGEFGGNIEVESEVGSGSAFVITFLK